jgi:glycosyltransferase involved in cell wall biosynthesis
MRLLFDATTTLPWADKPPVGTVRVERLFLSDLCRRLPREDLQFIKFEAEGFVKVSEAERALLYDLGLSPLQQARRPREEAARHGVAAGPGASRDGPGLTRNARRKFKRLMKRLRRSLRHPGPPSRATLQTALGHAQPVPSGLESFTDLITLGNGWDYLDYDYLYWFKRQCGLRVHAFVHDLIAVGYPHYFHKPANAADLHRHYAELCHSCDVLIANSFATRRAMDAFIAEEMLPRPDLRVAQLPGFVTETDPSPASLPAELQDEPFIVYVSTIEVRKNHRLLLHVWSECARQGLALPRLVLVGRLGWGVDEAVNMLRHDPALAGRVLVLHDVADDQLAALYRYCLFSVYPSTIEGWGLPVSEAMSLGKICIHSIDPAQAEASQGLMPAFHPDDYPGWKAEILSLARDEQRRAMFEAVIKERFRPRTHEEFCADMRAAVGLGSV